MLDLGLFRKPAFGGASIAAFSLSASMFAMFLYLTLYIQNMLGYKPFDAGLRFLPLSLVSFFVAPIAGRLSERVPVRWLSAAGCCSSARRCSRCARRRELGLDRPAARAS